MLENIWLPCGASLLPEHVLFVQVHAQRILATYNFGNRFPLVITVENTFPPLITVGDTFPPVITVRNTFPLVITVESTFPLLVTVRKNNGSSFSLKKRGTSEMSFTGHRRVFKNNISRTTLLRYFYSKYYNFDKEKLNLLTKLLWICQYKTFPN